jgi:hypothetical protein
VTTPPPAAPYAQGSAADYVWCVPDQLMPPTRGSSRTVLRIVLSLVVAFVVAAGVVVAVAVDRIDTGRSGQDHASYTVVLPSTFQGMTKVDSTEAGTEPTGLVDVDYAVGGNTSGTSLNVMAQTGGSATWYASLLDRTWDESTAAGVGTPVDENAGPLGGRLRCGVVRASEYYVPLCAWADDSSYVSLTDYSQMTLAVPSADDLAKLAATALALRSAAETPGNAT